MATFKDDNTMRLLSVNINGLQQEKWKVKNDLLRHFLKTYDFDIMGLQETNLNWHMLQAKDQWEERTIGWWEGGHTTIMAHNTQEMAPSAAQRGGTMLISINKPKSRILECGKDPSGLGRWVWTKYRGYQQRILRVISAYRCCHNTGHLSAFSQQRRYFDLNNDHRNPRDAMLDDLEANILQWIAAGELIILMIDMNEDTSSTRIQERLLRIGLYDPIVTKYRTTQGTAPTQQRGSTPIDGIFISRSLNMETGGYMPFKAAPTDHRPIWIDIKFQDVFGYSMKELVPPQMRRLKHEDPRVVKRWISSAEENVRKTKIAEKLFNIENQMDSMTDVMKQEYEEILLERKNIITQADKKCRKLKTGEVAFSGPIQKQREEIQLWATVVSRKKGTKVNSRFIQRLEKRVGLHNTLKTPLSVAIRKEREAYTRYYAMKQMDDTLRESWLSELAAAKAKENGGDHFTYYNNMLLRERQRRAARRLRYIRQKGHAGGLAMVQTQDDDGEVHTFTDKEDIERTCLQENKEKFNQTKDTPCMMSPLKEELGFLGTSEACQQILDGTYRVPQGTDPYTEAYFNELVRPIIDPATAPASTISTTTFKEGWSKMNEFISSGLSGIHFGHMKASAKSDLLSDFEAALCSIPYATGHSPTQWKTTINTMIEKKGKSPLVQNLRTINLMEPEFNFLNKVMGREVARCAEENQLLPKEQYGSRKRHQAKHHAVNKRLLYDINRLQRRPMILCSNDAKSCYDRIVHSIASMAMQRLGLKEQPIKCMLITLQEMDHFIRTGFGDSEIFTSANEDSIPFQGILQGNGAGPTLWLAVSTPLLEMMRTAGHGVRYRTPISYEQDQLVGFAFVDDTDIATGDLRMGQLDIDDVFDAMQEAIDCWEGGLKTTGGAIRPDKSFAYPLDFIFDETGACRYKTVNEIGRTLNVKDHTGRRQPLTLVEASVGKETLGVHLAPDGNNKDQYECMMKKVQTWAKQINAGHLPGKEAFAAISSTIMKTLEYPIVATTFTREECNRLVKPIHDAAFPHARICRQMPKAVKYGDKDSLGLGLDDLFVTQGLDKLTFLVEELKGSSMSSTLLKANLEWCIIHIGVGGKSLFEIPYDEYEFLLPEVWMKSLWQFTSEYKIRVDTSEFALKPRRENDEFLMEAFQRSGCTKGQLIRLNRCRMYLQVETLSDIVDGSGQCFSKRLYDGHRFNQRLPYHDWPEQANPSEKMWKLWRKALRDSFPRIRIGRLNVLRNPLGAWIDNKKHEWRWFYSPAAKRLYKREDNQMWNVYAPEREERVGIRCGTTFRHVIRSRFIPLDVYRVTVKFVRHNITRPIIEGWKEDTFTRNPTIAEQDENNLQWVINDTWQRNQGDTDYIIQELREGNSLIAVSDGSFHPEYKTGTAAWVITSPSNHQRRIYGNNVAPGQEHDQCPHRSELVGLLGVVRHVNKICAQYTITEGSIELACDGLEAYKAAARWTFHHTTDIGHFDIVTILHQEIRNSTLQWSFRHVKGHQDDVKHLSDIDLWGRLNMEVDLHAKAKLWDHIGHGNERILLTPISKSLAPISISHGGVTRIIPSHLKKQLRKFIARQTMLEYWQIHEKQVRNEDVDMEVFHHAARNLSPYRRRWLTKWSTGICGVGKWLQRWKEQPHSNCPLCLTTNETVEHVLHCPHESATICWTTSIEELREWIHSNHGIPGFSEAVCQRLLQWRRGEEPSNMPDWSQDVIRLMEQQDELGWDAFCFGTIHKGWAPTQDLYLKSLGLRSTGTAWMSRLLRRIWEVQYTLWEHRNSCVHKNGTSLHCQEEAAVNQAIREEFTIGRNGLSSEYEGLFRGSTERLIKGDTAARLQWLSSVWAGRDRLRKDQGLDPWRKNALASAFMVRHRARRKRKR